MEFMTLWTSFAADRHFKPTPKLNSDAIEASMACYIKSNLVFPQNENNQAMSMLTKKLRGDARRLCVYAMRIIFLLKAKHFVKGFKGLSYSSTRIIVPLVTKYQKTYLVWTKRIRLIDNIPGKIENLYEEITRGSACDNAFSEKIASIRAYTGALFIVDGVKTTNDFIRVMAENLESDIDELNWRLDTHMDDLTALGHKNPLLDQLIQEKKHHLELLVNELHIIDDVNKMFVFTDVPVTRKT